jgi:isoleucyl-tRNA synthetase
VVREPYRRLHRRYLAQTGWFYTLRAGDGLVRSASFRTCVAHGIVLGDDGQKMSKSLNNYPDPMMVFDTYGADAMRWYLLSSTILRGGDLAVTENGIRESVRHVVLPIWNTYSFFTMYANAAHHTAQRRTESTDPLDQYILGKLHALVTDVTASMDAYDLFAACGSIRTFLDVLTNWYVRR